MNNVDKQYFDLLKDILENGSIKETRSGNVRSVFGRTMRFNLSEGLPILTTKKVFTKGVIHELLWFLKGETNIKYLIENNVNIWTDDAYRHYKNLVNKHNEFCELKDSQTNKNLLDFYYHKIDIKNNNLFNDNNFKLNINFDDDNYDLDDLNDEFIDNDKSLREYAINLTKIEPISKDEFIEKIKNNEFISLFYEVNNYDEEFQSFDLTLFDYRYGDLGPVYGKQWREQGVKQIDQIQDIIDTLKTNPDDRRMICMAWNTNDFDEMALPPCHYGFQVYTRELNVLERLDWLCKHSNGEYDEWTTATHEKLDKLNVPKRELSLMWMQRSVDAGLGLPFNILSYSILTYMLAQCVNMTCGEVMCSLGDVHVYENHIQGLSEQLSRNPNTYKLPKLILNKDIKNINDFTFDDIKIENYESFPSIKLPLSVGG